MKAKHEAREMLAEYDFGKGARGKYAKCYAQGTNIVVIEPDVHRYFPTQKSVNEALRGLAEIIKQRGKTTRRAVNGQSTTNH